MNAILAASRLLALFVLSLPAAAITVSFISEVPTSAPYGGTTPFPYAMAATDDAGEPLAGVPFTFQVGDESACNFGGDPSATVLTGEDGSARSPLVNALAPNQVCLVGIFVAGEFYATATIWMFTPDTLSLVLDAGPDRVQAGSLNRYAFLVEAGPNAAYFPITVEVTRGPTGATASVEDILVVTGIAVVDLRGNDRPGNYELIVRAGPAVQVVRVKQVPHLPPPR